VLMVVLLLVLVVLLLGLLLMCTNSPKRPSVVPQCRWDAASRIHQRRCPPQQQKADAQSVRDVGLATKLENDGSMAARRAIDQADGSFVQKLPAG
jgi:hypothetical protein